MKGHRSVLFGAILALVASATAQSGTGSATGAVPSSTGVLTNGTQTTNETVSTGTVPIPESANELIEQSERLDRETTESEEAAEAAIKALGNSTTGANSTATGTTNSTLPKATPLTPPCGSQKGCTGEGNGTCSLPQREKRELPLYPRSPGGFSLKALQPRAYTADPNARNYARDIASGRAEANTLAISSIDRFNPILPEELALYASTSQVLVYDETLRNIPEEYTNRDGFNVYQGPLSGCTAVYIASKKAVFYAHYWETRAFTRDDAGNRVDFTGQVTRPMWEGKRERDDERIARRTQDSLAANAALFEGQDPEVFIMTPGLDDTGRELYARRIDQIMDAIQAIIPDAPDPVVHVYEKEDDGFYSEGQLDGHRPERRTNPATGRRENFYPHKVHRHTGSDGYAVFNYSRNQEGRRSGWRVHMGKRKYREFKWTPSRRRAAQ